VVSLEAWRMKLEDVESIMADDHFLMHVLKTLTSKYKLQNWK
jgi:hypothetical protein